MSIRRNWYIILLSCFSSYACLAQFTEIYWLEEINDQMEIANDTLALIMVDADDARDHLGNIRVNINDIAYDIDDIELNTGNTAQHTQDANVLLGTANSTLSGIATINQGMANDIADLKNHSNIDDSINPSDLSPDTDELDAEDAGDDLDSESGDLDDEVDGADPDLPGSAGFLGDIIDITLPTLGVQKTIDFPLSTIRDDWTDFTFDAEEYEDQITTVRSFAVFGLIIWTVLCTIKIFRVCL